MNRFRGQFFGGTFLLLVASMFAIMAHCRWRGVLPGYAYLTGWVFFGVMVLLTIYNARKKLPFLPLGSSESWLQIHIYLGFFTVVLFLVHLNFHLPRGWFDGTLGALYLLVTGSGVAGLILTRVIPRRLATRGGEVIYEKIPALRFSLCQQAETLALGSETKSPAISEFYTQQLSPFLTGPGRFWSHLLESRRPLNAVMTEIEEFRRYLGEGERATLEKLRELVRSKDGLDYHEALQKTLKLWLFVHLPLTYSLMIFSFVHIVLVFAFSAGAR